MEKNIFLVVKDKEDGALRPLAGIWRDNEAGRFSAEKYREKEKGVTIARVEMVDIEEVEE